MHVHEASVSPTVPIVVQVGFAGSRQLFDTALLGETAVAALETQLRDQLVERLGQLPALLGLSDQHFLCGVSQVAIGADTSFTQACAALGWVQRVLLPQPLNDFLGATDAQGEADFSTPQQQAARALLALPHVIEQRVVSASLDRTEQFEDANLEIVRECDVLVCLLREAAPGRAGGTRHLIERAAAAGKPVLEIVVSVQDGRALLSPPLPLSQWANGASFKPPGIPAELQGLAIPPSAPGTLPAAAAYLEAVRQCASRVTRHHSGLFKRAAIVIIVLHIVATVLATLAGKLQPPLWVIALLSLEVILLGVGLRTHHVLHRSAAARVWAVTRLMAETMRSLESVATTEVGLDYALSLSFPASFGPVLRTGAVLHAAQRRQAATPDWPAQRTHYVSERLTGARGQLHYFEATAKVAASKLRLAHRCFWVFSVGALVATSSKLVLVLGFAPGAHAAALGSWAGLFATALPVTAVGFLSWAAASDLEARAKTYADMHTFLAGQVRRLDGAGSRREFVRLARETELRILDENLGWFSRRLFSGVS